MSGTIAEPNKLEACTEKQIEAYVLPMMRGEKKDCYAITESGPGSDVSGLEATATKSGNNYVLNGEKWYVTSANFADFFWFQAQLPDEDDDALFLVDKDTEGLARSQSLFLNHAPLLSSKHRLTFGFLILSAFTCCGKGNRSRI